MPPAASTLPPPPVPTGEGCSCSCSPQLAPSAIATTAPKATAATRTRARGRLRTHPRINPSSQDDRRLFGGGLLELAEIDHHQAIAVVLDHSVYGRARRHRASPQRTRQAQRPEECQCSVGCNFEGSQHSIVLRGVRRSGEDNFAALSRDKPAPL